MHPTNKQLSSKYYKTNCHKQSKVKMSEFSAKQKALAIVPKPFATLSFIGSSYIIYHILNNVKRRRSVQYQILLGLSLSDVLFSIAVSCYKMLFGIDCVRFNCASLLYMYFQSSKCTTCLLGLFRNVADSRIRK